MLWVTHTLSKPSCMASLPAWLAFHVASHVQTVFFCVSVTTHNNGNLANPYYVLSCSSSLLDYPQEYSLRNTFVIPFCDVYLFAFLLVLSLVRCMHVVHTFASFSVNLGRTYIYLKQ